ncbi:unnamed protein product [Leptosia nina]|uniref:Uncharacterized protein n=1 Tax=Leptosia nina TaxID=320188 RepID=A0AAV1JG62_9NEOP
MYEPKCTVAVDELESWVELNSGGLSGAENEYIRLLREAQRESRDSSVRHSRASSMKGSPKSPPNSPNLEPSTEDELKGVYINCWRDDSNDWVWEWSSRPDQMPPKDWRFKHPVNARGPPSATSSIEVLEQQANMQQSHCLSVRRTRRYWRVAEQKRYAPTQIDHHQLKEKKERLIRWIHSDCKV